MNKIRKLSLNLSYTVILRIIQYISSLVAFFYIIHNVPQELIGKYQFVISVVSLVSVTALPGVRTALTQVVARNGTGPFKLASIYTTIGSAFGSIVLIGLSTYFFAYHNYILATSFAIAATINPLGQGLLVWRSSYYGREQYKHIAIVDSITAILTSSSLVASTFLSSDSSVPLVAAALAIPAIQNTIWWMREFSRPADEISSKAEIAGFGLKSSIYQLAPTIAQEVDKISIFSFVSSGDLAIYNAATKVPQMVKGLMSDVGSVLIPEFARIRYYSMRLNRAILLATLPVSVLIIVFAFTLFPPIYRIIIPAEYYDSIFYGQILLISVALIFYSDVQSKFIQSHSNIESFRALTLYGSITKILITPPLVYSFGIFGAIVSVLLQRIFSVIGVKWILVKHHMESTQ